MARATIAAGVLALALGLMTSGARAEEHAEPREITIYVDGSSPLSPALGRELVARGFHVIAKDVPRGGCWGEETLHAAQASELFVCVGDSALVFVGDGWRTRHTDTLPLEGAPEVTAMRVAETVRARAREQAAAVAALVPPRAEVLLPAPVSDAREQALESPFPTKEVAPPPKTSRVPIVPLVVPLVVAGVGAATTITGLALYVSGRADIPAACNGDTRTCAPNAPPVTVEAASAASSKATAGALTAVAGGLVLASGLAWWWLARDSASTTAVRTRSVMPFVGIGSAGLAGTF